MKWPKQTHMAERFVWRIAVCSAVKRMRGRYFQGPAVIGDLVARIGETICSAVSRGDNLNQRASSVK